MSKRNFYLSFALALLLQLMPWSGWFKPEFVLLVLLYWVLKAPHWCGLMTAWLLGVTMDIASGMLLGLNALAFTLTAFLAMFYQRRLILFTPLQQSGYIFLLILFNHVLASGLQLLMGYHYQPEFFLSTVISLLVWHLAHSLWLNRERSF